MDYKGKGGVSITLDFHENQAPTRMEYHPEKAAIFDGEQTNYLWSLPNDVKLGYYHVVSTDWTSLRQMVPLTVRFLLTFCGGISDELYRSAPTF